MNTFSKAFSTLLALVAIGCSVTALVSASTNRLAFEDALVVNVAQGMAGVEITAEAQGATRVFTCVKPADAEAPSPYLLCLAIEPGMRLDLVGQLEPDDVDVPGIRLVSFTAYPALAGGGAGDDTDEGGDASASP